ncbi:SAM-dependent methyltransferase [Marmoricola sp. OAE513]|uniref:class I SAM-dependent methyltransferase n=1 Tax=Marmoricola sp. OAE513 TaxID=2817894 RepID=UPI001AE2D647
MSGARIATAYDGRADEYIELFGSIDQLSPLDRGSIESWSRDIAGLVLDAGCGPGHWSAFMAEATRGDVLGVDASPVMIASARRRFPNARFVVGDLTALPLAGGVVSGILAWFSLIHMEPDELSVALGEFARASSPGCSLLLGYFEGTPRVAFDHAVATAYFWTESSLADVLGQAGWVVRDAATRLDRGHRPHGQLWAELEP